MPGDNHVGIWFLDERELFACVRDLVLHIKICCMSGDSHVVSWSESRGEQLVYFVPVGNISNQSNTQ